MPRLPKSGDVQISRLDEIASGFERFGHDDVLLESLEVFEVSSLGQAVDEMGSSLDT